MQIHQLQTKNKFKKKKRKGRGGKRGTYSGKGQKGQKARAGRKLEPAIRGVIKRYPKLRGYKFKKFDRKIVVLNLQDLEGKFKEGETITPLVLIEKKIIKKQKGKIPFVRILGKGEISTKLNFEQCYLSKSAKEKIEKCGTKK
ncbi:MAG: uL15 family ribosomal protein [Candidatus Pacebacteria bacterium]|nr:uL15 family ribosomal protein [Candidatus Paceibacterota bacterium]